MDRLLDASLIPRVRELISSRSASLVDDYRHLHAQPELSWDEHATANYVESRLRDLGLEPRRVATTGVVADFGRSDQPKRMLRADIDAVPVHEESGLDFTSNNPGVMHACGHDAHTAILLCAASVLVKLAPTRALRFMFQPAEEVPTSGAARCVAEGALDGVAEVVALHVWPALETGVLGLRDGAFTAAADVWECVLRGPGGHSARPRDTIDLVDLAARIVVELNAIPQRVLNSERETAVVTATMIHGGDAPNVIPQELRLAGTVRTLDMSRRDRLRATLESCVRRHVANAGAGVEWNCAPGPPAHVNDESLTQAARELLTAAFGSDGVVELDAPSLGSEDFAYLSQDRPALMLRLGCRAPGAPFHSLHSPRFCVSEDALVPGAVAMTLLGLLT